MTARADFRAALSHYGDHLAPIWHALPPDERGTWWAPVAIHPHLERLGVSRHDLRDGAPRARTLTVVASATDAAALKTWPVVLVEHGAGQAYDIDSASYSGGAGRDNVVAFLCPNEVSAGRNRAAYPDAAVEVVGSPRVEALRVAAAEGGGVPPTSRAVALSFHWDFTLRRDGQPYETGWAKPHYARVLPEVVASFPTIGHGHPRYRFVFERLWAELGIEHVAHFDDVVRRARCYVCDNSSTMYEWAALDRPVVVLNAPWYRRDVDLWPRFWRCADVGVQVDEPGDLVEAIATALEDPPEVAERRRAVVDEVYPHQDGRAALRSADAVQRALRAV